MDIPACRAYWRDSVGRRCFGFCASFLRVQPNAHDDVGFSIGCPRRNLQAAGNRLAECASTPAATLPSIAPLKIALHLRGRFAAAASVARMPSGDLPPSKISAMAATSQNLLVDVAHVGADDALLDALVDQRLRRGVRLEAEALLRFPQALAASAASAPSPNSQRRRAHQLLELRDGIRA